MALGSIAAQRLSDLRISLRSLLKTPGFAFAAVATIALGVGINSGLFSLINAIAFADVAARAPERLLAVNQDVRGVPRGRNNSAQFSLAEYEHYSDQATTTSGLLAYGRMWTATIGREQLRTAVATPVSCNYFDVLGIAVDLGRGFVNAQCEDAGNARVAVISYALWQNSFGGRVSVVGESVVVNGNALQIVGVAPEGFAGIDIDRPSVFVPLAAQRILRPDRNYLEEPSTAWLNVVGRMRDGVTADEVAAEIAVIGAQLDAEQQGRTTAVSVARATPLSAPDMRMAIFGAGGALLSVFMLVLLVACSNVANLMLARADMRMRETAIRLSLGATRGRLIAQLLSESLLIAVAGGIAGALAAAAGFRWLVVTVLASLPEEMGGVLQFDPAFDWRVFLFALFVSVAAGIGFGLVPALAATRPGLRTMIDRDAGAAQGQVRSRMRSTLVGLQVAVSMILVIATALLLRAFYEVRTVSPQFDHESLVVAAADLLAFGTEPEVAAAVQQQAVDRVGSLPGVEAVAQVLLTPLEARSRSIAFRLPEEEQGTELRVNNVSANFFEVAGIPLIRGRAFTTAELAAESTSVVVLTQSTANAYWPDQDPIGRSLVFEGFEPSIVEVIGIARDTEIARIGETDTRYVYMPLNERARAESQLLLRTSVPAAGLSAGIEAIYDDLVPEVPVRVRPLADNFVVWQAIASISAALSLGLAVLALTLASIGVFGVMSTVVGRRVREIGIRLALGAVRGDVVRLIMRKSMRPALIGAIAGLFVSLAAGRALSSLLFGVSPWDPLALFVAFAAVCGAAVLASVLPVRRALRVQPMSALRYE